MVLEILSDTLTYFCKKMLGKIALKIGWWLQDQKI